MRTCRRLSTVASVWPLLWVWEAHQEEIIELEIRSVNSVGGGGTEVRRKGLGSGKLKNFSFFLWVLCWPFEQPQPKVRFKIGAHIFFSYESIGWHYLKTGLSLVGHMSKESNLRSLYCQMCTVIPKASASREWNSSLFSERSMNKEISLSQLRLPETRTGPWKCRYRSLSLFWGCFSFCSLH